MIGMENNDHPRTLQELVAKLQEIIPWCDIVLSDPYNEGGITIITSLTVNKDKTTLSNHDKLGRGCHIHD